MCTDTLHKGDNDDDDYDNNNNNSNKSNDGDYGNNNNEWVYCCIDLTDSKTTTTMDIQVERKH
jgi:hypothetical protein